MQNGSTEETQSPHEIVIIDEGNRTPVSTDRAKQSSMRSMRLPPDVGRLLFQFLDMVDLISTTFCGLSWTETALDNLVEIGNHEDAETVEMTLEYFMSSNDIPHLNRVDLRARLANMFVDSGIVPTGKARSLSVLKLRRTKSGMRPWFRTPWQRSKNRQVMTMRRCLADLKILAVTNSYLKVKDLVDISSLWLSNLEELDLSFNDFRSGGWAAAAWRLPKLRTLVLNSCYMLNSSDFAACCGHNFPNLRKLCMLKCTYIGNGELAAAAASWDYQSSCGSAGFGRGSASSSEGSALGSALAPRNGWWNRPLPWSRPPPLPSSGPPSVGHGGGEEEKKNNGPPSSSEHDRKEGTAGAQLDEKVRRYHKSRSRRGLPKPKGTVRLPASRGKHRRGTRHPRYHQLKHADGDAEGTRGPVCYPKLEWLDLSCTQLREIDLAYFSMGRFPELRSLSVWKCKKLLADAMVNAEGDEPRPLSLPYLPKLQYIGGGKGLTFLSQEP